MRPVALDVFRRRLSRFAAVAVANAIFATSLTVPAGAQIARSSAPGGAQHLIINILEGEGALNNIKQRDAREPVVQVTDENHKPVAGVALVFLIHGGKGTATFGTNSLTLSTTTDAQGIAHAAGLHLGTKAGSFTISVTASVGAMVVATAIIHQTNVIGALASSTTASTTTASSATTGSSATTAGTTTAGTTTAGTASATGASASTTAATVAHHGLLHFLLTPKVLIGGAIVAGTVVGVVVATQSGSSTSISLGGTTVGHP